MRKLLSLAFSYGLYVINANGSGRTLVTPVNGDVTTLNSSLSWQPVVTVGPDPSPSPGSGSSIGSDISPRLADLETLPDAGLPGAPYLVPLAAAAAWRARRRGPAGDVRKRAFTPSVFGR